MNIRLTIIIPILIICLTSIVLFAQPENIIIEYNKKFKGHKSSPAVFPHGLHMEELECLDCHHDYKNGKNVLDEGDLEDGADGILCIFCHKIEKCCDLQKVFHGQCMTCHIEKQKNKQKSGPRMCIGCHPQKKGAHKTHQGGGINGKSGTKTSGTDNKNN